jgi:DNA topoisomerase I
VFYGPYVKFKDVELPALKEKDSVDVSKIDKLSKETQPPKRYTQSSIIKELEKRNLGTKCLTSNNFVKVNSDSKVHTENIAELFDTLYANFPIQDDSSMKIALNDKKTCFSFDGFDETRSCFNLVSKRKLNKGEAVYRIEYIDGTFIEATSEHPFLVLDNDKVRYLQAEKLSKGMKSICSDTFPDKTGEVICTWEDFLNKCNEKSKLYAVTDELKSLRKKLKLTQYDFEERYHVQQPRLSVYERKKSVPLYLLNRFGLSQPDSFTSANKLVSIKNPFPLRMTSSLARLLANLVGDCSIDRERIKKENVYDFRYHNTNLELINRFISDIKNVFGITLVPQLAKPRPGHLQIYYVKVPAVVGRILAMLFEEVLTKNAYEKLHSDFYPEYVGALFDDEGHAADSEPKLFISNINFKLLERVRLMLNHLGIESKISKKQFKLYIRGRRNIHLFLEKIPIASVSKKQRLVNTLSAFYKYGNEESSPLKQYMILSALGKAANKDLTTKELVRQIGFNEPMLREHLKYLRKYGYVKQITRGISAYPRKKITYRLMIPIERTFYKYVGEQVVSRDFITKTIQSVTRVDYSGFVYDITNTPELPNFVLSNGVVVHNSTRADILDTLFKRGYANGKQIQVTQLGMQTAETLEKYVPEIMDDELTREFEDEMEQIRAGKVTEANVLKTAQEFLNKVLSKFKKHEKSIGEELLKAVQETRDEERTLGACQVCGEGTLKIIRSKKTKKIFAACDKYPECETTYPLPQGALVKPHDKSCEQCTFPMVMVIRRGRRPQMLCINPECPTKKLEEAAAKEAEKLAAGKLEKKCPECGSELVVRKSFYGMFIGCSGYPKCRHTEKLEKKDEFGKGKNVVKKKVKRKVKKKGKRKVKKK